MVTSATRYLLLIGFTLGLRGLFAASAAPRAAIFTDTLPGQDKAFVQEVAAHVSGVGYDVEFIDITTLTNASNLSTARFDLLVLPGARSLPAVAAGAVENYLKQGGDLLALGLPAWESPLFELNGRWISRADFDRELIAQRPQHLLFDFAKTDLQLWSRATDESRNPTHHEISEARDGKALHVVIERFTGWETYQSPALTNPFPPGHTLTCFRAKGTAQTKQLALEWTERDGSRWIATVDLTTEWKNYALPPAAFKAWLPPPNRAGKEDHLRVDNAARLVVGIAHSHTAVEGSRHEYWIADIGTAPNPFGNAKLPDEFKPPHLESFSPGYQFHPISGRVTASFPNTVVSRLRTPAEGSARPANFNGEVTNAAPGSWLAIHPRPRGVGFNQDRAYRWEPLLAARDAESGDFRGTLAALLVQVKPPFRGGVWAVFTPAEAGFYRQPLVTNCLGQNLKRMKRGIFLTEGGAEFFTVFPDQKFNIGAQVANFSSQIASNVSVVIELQDTFGRLKSHSGGSGFTLAPNEIVSERRAVQGLNANEF